MTTAVFDTSALLAHLNRETGAEVVEAWLDRGGSAVSALTVQELTKKIAERGGTREDADVTVDDLGLAVHHLTRDLGLDAGAMVTVTKPKGLSEGDRACLALARHLEVPAVTADRPWADVAGEVGVRVELIR